MTKEEIRGLRIALNVRGYRAMRHLSRRAFVVGLAFWIPLPKEKLCDWEDIVSRLSLGLIWNMVSEMRHRYALRVERDGKGTVFHHFVDYLLNVCVEDNDVATRDCVIQTCSESGGDVQGVYWVCQRVRSRTVHLSRGPGQPHVSVRSHWGSHVQGVCDSHEEAIEQVNIGLM